MKTPAYWIDNFSSVATFVKSASPFDSYAMDDYRELQLLSPNETNPAKVPGFEIAKALPVVPRLIMVHRSNDDAFDAAIGEPRKIVEPAEGWKIFLYSTEGNPPPSDKPSLSNAVRILRPIGNLAASDFQELGQYALQETDCLPRCCRPSRPDFTIATAIAVRGCLLLFKEPTSAKESENDLLRQEREQAWADAQKWIFCALDVADCAELQQKLKGDGHSETLANNLADQAKIALDGSCAKEFSARLTSLLKALENALQ